MQCPVTIRVCGLPCVGTSMTPVWLAADSAKAISQLLGVCNHIEHHIRCWYIQCTSCACALNSWGFSRFVHTHGSVERGNDVLLCVLKHNTSSHLLEAKQLRGLVDTCPHIVPARFTSHWTHELPSSGAYMCAIASIRMAHLMVCACLHTAFRSDCRSMSGVPHSLVRLIELRLLSRGLQAIPRIA